MIEIDWTVFSFQEAQRSEEIQQSSNKLQKHMRLESECEGMFFGGHTQRALQNIYAKT